MNIMQSFDAARAAIAPVPATVNESGGRDYLVMTCRDIREVRSIAELGSREAYMHPLSFRDEANEALNSMTRWLVQENGLDQRAEFGEQTERYNLGLYRMSDASLTYPSLVEEFVLDDYLFPDRRLSDAGCFDDLMRMVDRDRLALEMRDALVGAFGMPLREDAPNFWRRDIRQASHPDWKIHTAPALARG